MRAECMRCIGMINTLKSDQQTSPYIPSLNHHDQTTQPASFLLMDVT